MPVAVSLLSPLWCWAANNSKPTQLHIPSLGDTDSKQILMMRELEVHLFWTFSSALLAELLAGVFSSLTNNRSW